MVEQSVEEKIHNVEIQKKYTGLAFDFLNAGMFPGHYSDQLVETKAYLKGFFDALDANLKSLQDQLPKPIPETPAAVAEVIPAEVVPEVSK